MSGNEVEIVSVWTNQQQQHIPQITMEELAQKSIEDIEGRNIWIDTFLLFVTGC